MFDYILSKKYVILLILICVIFLILVAKAFEYIPSSDNAEKRVRNETGTQSYNQESINKNSNYNENKYDENDEYEDDYREQQDKKNEYTKYKSKKNANSQGDSNYYEEVEEVNAPHDSIYESNVYVNNNSNDNNGLSEYLKARKYLSEGNFSKALSELEKAKNLTSDKELLSLIYQGMALTYANNREYVTALSYANKAYDVSPSLAGQVLIIKIYKASGQTDQAITRLNNIIEQEFATK